MRKKKVYLAAPLFSIMERSYNSDLRRFIQDLGLDVFLPQDDVGVSYELILSNDKSEVRNRIFASDVRGIKECDIMIILLDGRVPDEGACVELGIGWALGKTCIAFKTDKRAMDINGDNNIMIDGCTGFRTVQSLETLKEVLLGLR